MNYVLLRFKNNIKKILVFFLVTFILSSFVFYANENFINSDKSKLAIIDLDNTALSKELVENLQENETIKLITRDDLETARTDLYIKKVDFIAVILNGFAQNINDDLYEDSIDIYYRESDAKTDIVRDTLSIGVVKIWVGEEFADLDVDSKNQEIKKYLDMVIRYESGEIVGDKNFPKASLLAFLFAISLAWIIICRDFFTEEKMGIRYKLSQFGINISYYLDVLLFRVLVAEVLVLALYLANVLFSGEVLSLAKLLKINALGYLYAFVLELIAFILSKFTKKLSSFSLLMEIIALLIMTAMLFWL